MLSKRKEVEFNGENPTALNLTYYYTKISNLDF